MNEQKKIVTNGMKALFQDFDKDAIRTYFHDHYIQHNPNVPTGLEPIIGMLPSMKDVNFSFTTHRMISDGDLVLTHNTGNNAMVFGSEKIVTFDLWRVEDGKIIEHWDAITPLVEKTVNGRTQIDGASEVKDLDKTSENKELIKSFMSDILMGKNSQKITEYINQEEYAQHNPNIWDGFDGLIKTIEQLVSQDNMFVYNKIHRIIGEGNFVLAQSEGAWNGKPQVFYDLFRIESGKLVEHWDVIQEIPEKMAHNNTMF
ncbi:nuclear transport factor 2 family protein [Aquimarina sp. LLG6339-5]|uniref:nuclear transport factor 2 family protein n=1 Tax=Aquimarina sp. LLG6339-5 TaxID=3160830 RepID=UPI003863FF39